VSESFDPLDGWLYWITASGLVTGAGVGVEVGVGVVDLSRISDNLPASPHTHL
jgi:hypothetical protein